MTLEKKELEMVFNVLKETNLNLQDSRIRDSFLKQVGIELDQFNKDKTAIYLEYCDKNEDGTPEIVDGKYHFQNNVLEKINDEITTLLSETVELSIDNPDTLDKIKSFVEKTDYSPKIGEVEIIDSFITKL